MAQTGQPYAFTGDDPLNTSDPSGLMPVCGGCAPGANNTRHITVASAPKKRTRCICSSPIGLTAAAIGPPASWRYAQKTFSPTFSNSTETLPAVRGKSVADVAEELQNGDLWAGDLPVQVGVIDNHTLILNTRSAQALTQAGIPRSDWYINDVSNVPDAMDRLETQLSNNGLSPEGFIGEPVTIEEPGVSFWGLFEDAFGEGGDTDG